MAVSFCHHYCHFSSLYSSSSLGSRPPATLASPSSISRPRISASSTSSPMDFPYVSPPHRNLMVDLLSTVDTRLGSQLLPCTLPPDIQRFQNQSGNAHGSLHIRSGHKSSPVIFLHFYFNPIFSFLIYSSGFNVLWNTIMLPSQYLNHSY